jgi:GR25 family glycosyltransferase involved in LPS biosynthesis
MIFNTLFDKIYVLNLKESEDRRNHINKEFERVGINNYEFFEGTRYDSEEVEKLMKSDFVKKFPNCFRCNQKRCYCENNFLTKYQIGNWCSFLNIFRTIIKNNYKFVLICEDDIVFTNQYKQIINSLFSKTSFRYYNINMNTPLLIRIGSAFRGENHNSRASPIFLKNNYSLCNPCFAVNLEMVKVYMDRLKIIDYHSDIYFHKTIPKTVRGIQHFTMYPFPVYELSFVKSHQKFESTVRPNAGIRHIEYKEFLYITSNNLLNIFIKKLHKNLELKEDTIGFNGNINSYILMDKEEQKKYYFENKILLLDDYYDDIKIIYKNTIYYEKYIEKIYNDYGVFIDFTIKSENILKKLITFYKYYMKLVEDSIPNLQKVYVKDLDRFFPKELDDYIKFKNIFIKDVNIDEENINGVLHKLPLHLVSPPEIKLNN